MRPLRQAPRRLLSALATLPRLESSEGSAATTLQVARALCAWHVRDVRSGASTSARAPKIDAWSHTHMSNDRPSRPCAGGERYAARVSVAAGELV